MPDTTYGAGLYGDGTYGEAAATPSDRINTGGLFDESLTGGLVRGDDATRSGVVVEPKLGGEVD